MKKPISAEFPFEPRFAEVQGSRMHYVDVGTGDPVLFLHGNPTYSYIWRNIIPHISGLGRCIALDLIGMGRSDNPEIDYTFFDHSKYVENFIDVLGLRNVTLVLHDWGSALGFHYATRNEDNVKGLAFMEAILSPVPSWDDFPAEWKEIFVNFRTPKVGWDLIVNQNVFIEKIIPGATVRKLTEKEMDYYREPYVIPADRKPVWVWPNQIPIAGEPADVVEAVETYNRKLQQSDLPKLLLYATPGGLVPKPMVDWCKANLKNLESVSIGKGIHYVQEDNPHKIGAELAKWYKRL